MGTNPRGHQSQAGLLPRAIEQIFSRCREQQGVRESVLKASFIQIYNDLILDLLGSSADIERIKAKQMQSPASIREEETGAISLLGVTEVRVETPLDLYRLLERGALQRSTASTNMNETSSRSHGIFTIFLEQHLIEDLFKGQATSSTADGYLCAKFRFVDLAGSERPKKTGAVGATMKEGIKINMGLLALGNVISALTEGKKRYIPYRDSKLTRLLQDSLGGNANTLMIACLSPAQSNFEETLNTLKYATRAMNIENKVVKNLDPQEALISQLKQRIFYLENQLKKRGRSTDLEPVSGRQSLIRELKERSEEQARKLTSLQIECYSSQQNYHTSSARVAVLQKLLAQNGVLIPQSEGEQFEQLLKQKSQALQKATQELAQSALREETLRQQVERLHGEKLQVEQALSSCVKASVRDSSEYFKKSLVYDLQRTCPAEVEEVMSKIMECEHSIEADEEIERAQHQLERSRGLVRLELDSISNEIKEKEQTLKAFRQEHTQLESNLLSQFKEGYCRKIKCLETELRLMQKQRDDALAQGDKPRAQTLKSRIGEAENSVRQIQKKDRAMRDLQSTVDHQLGKIRDLDREIRLFKEQRLDILKKSKEEHQRYERLRLEKYRELLEAQRRLREKEGANKKLKLETLRAQDLAKRKILQLNRLKVSNQTLKSLLSKRAVRTNLNSDVEGLVQQLLTRMLLEVSRGLEVSELEQELSCAEMRLADEIEKEAMLKLQLGRHRSSGEEEQKQRIECREARHNLQTLEESIGFLRGRLRTLVEEGTGFDPETILLKRIEGASAATLTELALALLEKIGGLTEEFLLQRKSSELSAKRVAELEELAQSLRESAMLEQERFSKELERLREEVLIRMSSEDEEEPVQKLGRVPFPQPAVQHAEEAKKAYEKKIQELNRKLKHSQLDLEQMKRKCNVVQEKYDSIKRIKVKDRFIGLKKEDSVQKFVPLRERKLRQGVSEAALFTPSQHHRRASVDDEFFLEVQEDPPLNDSQDKKWEPFAKIDAHAAPVLSLSRHENSLFTTASKSIRQWDIEQGQLIEDLSNHPSLQGFVKTTLPIPEHNLLVSICDKSISLWDIRSLQHVNTLRKFPDEVRALHYFENSLITGGKGTAGSGAIQFWDLRNCVCFEEKDKSQDVFSFAELSRVLFFGNRSHQVRRLHLDTKESLAQYQPPHFDIVSALAEVGGQFVVSGSRDKSVKVWHGQTMLTSTYISNDWINLVRSGKTGRRIFYVGARDGQLKGCWLKEGKVHIFGSIQTSSTSLNGLVELEGGNLVSAGSDQTVKVWRPYQQTLQFIQRTESIQ